MLLFIVLVLVGFFYIWKKGVLDWSQEAMDAFRSEELATPKLSGRGYTLVEDKSSAVDRKVTLDK